MDLYEYLIEENQRMLLAIKSALEFIENDHRENRDMGNSVNSGLNAVKHILTPAVFDKVTIE